MTNAQGIVKGALYFLIAGIFIYVTWYAIPTFSDAFSDPSLKAFFWIGLILTYIFHLLVVPLLLITQQIEIKIQVLGKVAGMFLLGIIYTLVAWYILPEIIEAIDLTATTEYVFYGIIILTSLLAMTVLPNIALFTQKTTEEEATE